MTLKVERFTCRYCNKETTLICSCNKKTIDLWDTSKRRLKAKQLNLEKNKGKI